MEDELNDLFETAFFLGYRLIVSQQDDFTFLAGAYQADGRRYEWATGSTLLGALKRLFKVAEGRLVKKKDDYDDLIGGK